MEPVSGPIDPTADRVIQPAPSELSPGAEGRTGSRLGRGSLGLRFGMLSLELQRFRVAILVYLGTRVLLLLVAVMNAALRHHPITDQLAHWDGLWYRDLADNGYPAHALHTRTTLGFFPLYPLVIRLVADVLPWWDSVTAITLAGVIVSTTGGLVATVLVQRLASCWWGEASGRRAAVAFCLFPGSVVFSMVYAEGILIPLAAGCLLALQRRRWLAAGILAAFATASEPEALVLIVVCALSAALELRRRGWGSPAGRRSLLAPLLALTGVGAFAVYLWAHTGTPFATMIAQRYGWGETSDPLALVHLARRLAREVSFSHFNHPTINLNLVIGLAGAVLLIGLLVLMWRCRETMSIEAILWTVGVSLLAVTSEYTPPNPRLLITAFPALLLIGHHVRGRAFSWLMWTMAVLLAGLSALTFIGTTLRP